MGVPQPVISSTTRDEVLAMLRLAVPVVIAELGWMTMGLVDTIMVGDLGPAAIGATGVGSSLFYSFAIFGIGLLLGLDTLVAQARGAGDRLDCHRSLTQGVYIALFVGLPLTASFALIPQLFAPLGVNQHVAALASDFIGNLKWSTVPLLLYAAFRRYLQGMGHVRPVMFVLVSANLVNWFANWLLIYGHWGFPALGVGGSALSTCFARIYMAGLLVFFIWWFEHKQAPGLKTLWRRPDWGRIALLLRIGLPAATQILLEVGAFGAATVAASKLTPADLAAHQLSILTASVTYMVPLGISSAAAVAVGHAIGQRQPGRARREGFIAIGLGCCFMLLSAAAFILAPLPILHVYTSDERVLRTGSSLLKLAALFQLFDGIQTIATGSLRGIGNTRTPMLVNLIGYWLFGLPLGYVLCFQTGLGIFGLWIGLTISLIVIALLLLRSWNVHSARLTVA